MSSILIVVSIVIISNVTVLTIISKVIINNVTVLSIISRVIISIAIVSVENSKVFHLGRFSLSQKRLDK
jgi:hypothetical protein